MPDRPIRSSALTVIAVLVLGIVARAAGPAKIHGIGLVWHWEDGAGQVESHLADESINPASVVKLATTLWAMEELGPEHRFRTRFAIRGEIDPAAGVLRGDLFVLGAGDPDFHVENAQAVARELIDAGIRKIDGALYANDGFWIGWERGAEGRIDDPERRAREMTERLADAWNPRRWTSATLRGMRRYRERTGSDVPFVHLEVGVTRGLAPAGPEPFVLVEHVSNPLSVTLKRFNDYSNNDIERLGYLLGDATAMTAFYTGRWNNPQPPVRFETLSGLGSNRLSPRQIVRILRELEHSAGEHGLRQDDLLPALDCGRNTLRNYPGLVAGLPRGSLVGKTGTLVQTDGGVVALAGIIEAGQADVSFCVVAPQNGARMSAARRAQTRWLLDRAAGWEIAATDCLAAEYYSYSDASVVLLPNVGASSRTHTPPGALPQ